MNKFLVVLCLCSCFSLPVLAGQPDSIYGVWMFKDAAVFIEIKKDNSAFQCRASDGPTMITSTGKFDGESKIEWGKIHAFDKDGKQVKLSLSTWGANTVSVDKDILTMRDDNGEYIFKRFSQMPKLCKLNVATN